MEGLVLVLIAAGVLIALLLHGTAQNKAIRETTHAGGLAPDYVWRGKLFLSIEDAARRGGDGGAKLWLGLYKSSRFIRLIFETKEVYHFIHVAFEAKRVYEISFDEISDVKSVFTPISVAVVGVRNDDFPPNEIILYSSGRSPSALRDMLREAMKSDRQRSIP